MRKDNEIASLRESLARMKAELVEAQKTVFRAKDQESSVLRKLAEERGRSSTLEKLMLASSPESGSSARQGMSLRDQRPAALVRRYGELYSQVRLETLDALDRLPQLVNAEELKNKLLFSVMVVRHVVFEETI